eukprot:5500622-Pyramimonas_sp.AAC.3
MDTTKPARPAPERHESTAPDSESTTSDHESPAPDHNFSVFGSRARAPPGVLGGCYLGGLQSRFLPMKAGGNLQLAHPIAVVQSVLCSTGAQQTAPRSAEVNQVY